MKLCDGNSFLSVLYMYISVPQHQRYPAPPITSMSLPYLFIAPPNGAGLSSPRLCGGGIGFTRST